MGVPVVPADLEAPPGLQEQQEEQNAELTAETGPVVAATLDETLQHVESVGRPHDWWWAVNNWRKQRAIAVFGSEVCGRFEATLISKYWLLLTVTITLFCLYAVDVCDLAAGSVEARTVVSGLLLAIFVIFSLELILSSTFVDKYILSFFFWVDLIGTASLILDIQWFVYGILDEEDSNALQITRAGRAARIGSQMGRITRVLRMLRALKLLKVLQLRKRIKHGIEPLGTGNGPMRPTVLGELLAESTTRKCVVVILFVLVVATFLQTFPATAADYERIQLVSYGIMTPEAFIQSSPHPVILMSYVDARDGGLVDVVPYTRRNMRRSMQLRTQVACDKYNGSQVEMCGFANDYSTIWYDVTKRQQLNAGFNLILTTVIIACLGLSAYFFGRDATTYVIMPIETMLKYLRRMIMVGVDGDVESEHINFRKAPETDVLANYVSRLVNEIDNARWKAEEEARISDTLLNSMVPPRIARQLKELRWWEAGPEQRAQTIADSFPHATVLFTDIVGFTVLSSRISAEDAMRHLNNMYTIFDEIVEKYGLYKVETIGDSYMLVGGAPEERLDHAERVAAAALEIRACVPLLHEMSGEPGINVRIGMHSGAVTAGVVGFKNPRWHLFGDTCNTASRMESTGIAGEIQLSCTTYELIKERFQCKVRGKIAVKGKGEMVTYLLEREYGTDKPPDSPSGLGTVGGVPMGSPGGGGAADAMDREAFLASPQFKKAMERYTTARSSFLAEEQELCKLLKTLDDATASAAAAAARADLPNSPPPSPLPGLSAPLPDGNAAPAAPTSTPEAVAAAGAVVPRLAVGLGAGPFKQLVLMGSTPSDLKALAIHMHEELSMARAMMAAAEEEKAAGIRRDMLLKLYARVLEAPGMSLRDTFATILDTLYKVIECDVIKMYVVDHTRGQLWPATRYSATDANRTLPLEGTLAGSVVRRARLLRVDDVAREEEFNVELEELPSGYTSKSMMCVPVFGVTTYHAPGHHYRLNGFGLGGGGGGSMHHGSAHTHHGSAHGALTPGTAPAGATPGQAGLFSGDVIALLVMVNRWTPWREAGAEEGERRIVPFSAADEAAVRDAASSVGLLLMRRRGEMLLASAVPPHGLAGASFSVAALPASVARQRLRTVARRSSVALLDTRGNLWGMKQEELMGQARDVFSALPRRMHPSALSVLALVDEEIFVSFLVRIADEQGAGRFFNLAHSVGVLQGIYLTLLTHTELAGALGPQHLLALVLAAALLNVDRDGELLPAVPTGGGGMGIGSSGVVSGVAVGRTSRARNVGGSAGVATAAATGLFYLTPTSCRGTLQPQAAATATQNHEPAPPPSKQEPSQRQQEQPPKGEQQQPRQQQLPQTQLPLPPALVLGSGVSSEGSAAQPVARLAMAAMMADPVPSASSFKRSISRFASGLPSSAPSPPIASELASSVAPSPGSRGAGSDGDGEGGAAPAAEMPRPAADMAAASDGDENDETVTADDTKGQSPRVQPRESRAGLPSGPYASVPLPPSASALATDGVPMAATVSIALPASGVPLIPPPLTYSTRNRAVSARRGRLAAIVDDILSGDTNVLSGLASAEAAGVKACIVSLLALRNQPQTVLSMPGLQLLRGGTAAGLATANMPTSGTAAGGGDAGPVSAALGTFGVDGGSAFGSVAGVAAAKAALACVEQEGPKEQDGGVAGGDGDGGGDTSGVPLLPPPPQRPPNRYTDRSGSAKSKGPSGSDAATEAEPSAAAAAAAAAAPAAVTSHGDSDRPTILQAKQGSGIRRGGGSDNEHYSSSGGGHLAALIQAASSDPNRLAETRMAVCALLLLTWSELLHCKDPGTALSLLQCRATDVKNWASRLAANMSARRRSATLMGAMDHGVDDVQNLLLLEVPRMQLEVIPLWQRTVELLPGLQPQLDALQANRATYVAMLQDTAALTGGPMYGSGGVSGAAGAALSGPPSARAAGQQRTSSGSAATTAGGSWRPSLLRENAFLEGAPSGREPRRFISAKQRFGVLARSVLGVMPSGDSTDSNTVAAMAPGHRISDGGRVYARASSSRSYAGRTGPDYLETFGTESGDAVTVSGGIVGVSVGGVSGVGGERRVSRQGCLAISSAAGARSLRRAASRSGAPQQAPPGSRLASLAQQASGIVGFVLGAPGAATAGGPDLDGSTGHRTSGSNQSFVAQASRPASGFRPRFHTHDVGSPAAAAATGPTSPVEPGGASGGQRRSSITSRLNLLFTSFRASGRMAPRHTGEGMGGAGAASVVGVGGSSHVNAGTLTASPIALTPASPRPALFPSGTPFETYDYELAGCGLHDNALASQGSLQLSNSLAAAIGGLLPATASAGGAFAGGGTAAGAGLSLGSMPSQQLHEGAGGRVGATSGDGRLTATASTSQLPLLQPAAAALSPVTSWRRPVSHHATSADGVADAAVGGRGSGAAGALGSHAVGGQPATALLASRRDHGSSLPSRSKLRASIMRRLSHVASKLHLHAPHVNTTSDNNAMTNNNISTNNINSSNFSGHAYAPSGHAVGADRSSAAAAMDGVLSTLPDPAGMRMRASDGGALLQTADRSSARESGSGRLQNSSSMSLPVYGAPPNGTPPLLLRSGTIEEDQSGGSQLMYYTRLTPHRQQTQQLMQLEATPAPSPATAAAAAALTRPGQGPPTPRRRRAPSGALALAQQHEQYAATVAAAAVAFAARQAAARQSGAGGGGAAAADSDGDRDGGDSGYESAGLKTATGSMLSYVGSGLGAGGALPTVAEFSVSGRNSSATGTARSSSTAAQGDTPKHAGGLPPAASRLSFTGGVAGTPPAAAAAAAAAGTLAPFRFAPAPGSPRYMTRGEIAPMGAPVMARTSQAGDVGIAVAPAAFPAPGGGGGAEVAEPTRVTPARASSKGVWLGLRLATDALLSVGRSRADGGHAATAAGGLLLETGLVESDLETPKMTGAFATSAGRSARNTTAGAGAGAASSPLPSIAAAAAATTGIFGGGGIASGGAGSSVSVSRSTSRTQTPTASLRRGGAAAAASAPVQVGVGGVASLQAVIEMAEAALAGGGGGPPQYRGSQGSPAASAGVSRNQSHRRTGPPLSTGAAASIAGGAGAGVSPFQQSSNPPTNWSVDEPANVNQRTSAPPAPSRFSLRRTQASRNFSDQPSPLSGAPSLQPEQLTEEV